MWLDQSRFGSDSSFRVLLAGQETQIVNLGKKTLNVAQDKSCLLEGNGNGKRNFFFS